jgi:hypothetical protein
MALSDDDVQRIAAAVWGFMLSGERVGYPDGPAQVFVVDGRRDAATAATRNIGREVWFDTNLDGQRAGYPDGPGTVFLVDARQDAARAATQTAPPQ